MSNNAMTVFRQELEHKMAPEMGRVVPAHLPVPRLVRTITNAVSANPKLLDANRGSLWQACMTSAVLGLEPDGVTGQGHLVPFKGKVQFIPGYRGLITLAFHAGYIVEGHVVRKLDQFAYEYGLAPKLVHTPDRSIERGAENPITAAYAVARHADAPSVFRVVEMPEIINTRNRSSGYQYAIGKNKEKPDTPWATDFDAMAKKTAIRQLAGNLPLQVQKAVALEAMFDQGKTAWATKAEDGTTVIETEAEVPGARDVIDAEYGEVNDGEVPFDDD